MKTIGIIVAMEKEFAQLRTLLNHAVTETHYERTFVTGTIGDNRIIMQQCGIGKVNAAVGTASMLVHFKPDAVVNTGVAGAADAQVNVMDVVAGERVAYHDVWCGPGTRWGVVQGLPQYYEGASLLLGALPQVDTLHRGLIASGDQFIAGGEKKAFIVNNFKLQCVEMEGCAIAHTCFANSVPFVIIRCMSDCADETVKETYSEDTASKLSSTFLLEVIKEI